MKPGECGGGESMRKYEVKEAYREGDSDVM